MAEQPEHYTSNSSLVQWNFPATGRWQNHTDYPNIPPASESIELGIPYHTRASTPTPEHYGLDPNPTIPPREFVYHSNPSHFTQYPPPYSVTATGKAELTKNFRTVFAAEVNERERKRSRTALQGVCSQAVMCICLFTAGGEPTPGMRGTIMNEVIQRASRCGVTVTGKDIAKHIRFASCVLTNLCD